MDAQHLAVFDDLHVADARLLARQARVLAEEGVLAVHRQEVLRLHKPGQRQRQDEGSSGYGFVCLDHVSELQCVRLDKPGRGQGSVRDQATAVCIAAHARAAACVAP